MIINHQCQKMGLPTGELGDSAEVRHKVFVLLGGPGSSTHILVILVNDQV